ncbi:MAG: hypothetical protein K8S16_00955 [Bacteroidales bacterium]|nr:hypothetical protein [Bacteroidales bacterium]
MTRKEIAEILWKIHSHSLYPFYGDKKAHEDKWEDLSDREKNNNDVSKEFFLKIADMLLKRIEESEKQIENGEFYSDEQVDKIIDKWLEE